MRKLLLLLFLYAFPVSAQQYHVKDSPLQSENYRIALGLVPGVTPLNKFGRSSDVDAILTDIWDGANTTDNIVEIASHSVARALKVYSTSAEDTSAGIGCRTIEVFGVDYLFERSSETISLNGVSLVASVTTYLGIDRVKCVTAGNNATNSGNIYVGFSVVDTTQAMITNGAAHNDQSLMAITYVGVNETVIINQYYADINKATGQSAFTDIVLNIRTFAMTPNSPFQVKNYASVTSAGSSHIPHKFDPPIAVVGPAIIKMRALGSTADLDVSAGFDGIRVAHQ